MKMKKIFVFIAILFITPLATMFGQVYDAELKWKVYSRLEFYDKSDKIVQQIVEVVDLFDKGKPLSAEFINKNLYVLGVTYLLFEDIDCPYYFECTKPAVSPAAFQILNGQIGMMGLGKIPTLHTKRPLSDFVVKYFDGLLLNKSPEMNFIMRNRVLPQGVFSYENNAAETVILDESNSFARINGNDIILITISQDTRNVMIYTFKVDFMETQMELFRNEPTRAENKPISYSQTTQDMLTNLREEEKEYNEFGKMLEEIVNHSEVTPYYHDKEMFIVANGRFRNDLEVKYNGLNMLILVMPVKDIKSYIDFIDVSYDYDAGKAAFTFKIPEEGVTGSAIFVRNGEKWVLKQMFVVE